MCLALFSPISVDAQRRTKGPSYGAGIHVLLQGFCRPACQRVGTASHLVAVFVQSCSFFRRSHRVVSVLDGFP